MLNSKRIFTLVALAGLLGAPLVASNLVANPGFELGDWTGWTAIRGTATCTNLSVADFSETGVVGVNSGLFAANFGGACSGEYDTITQDIPTVAGAAYTFSFWLSASDPTDNGAIVLWDGAPVLNLTNFVMDYTLFSFSETASSDTTTIAFQGYDLPDWNRLDDVSVDLVDASAPEPATWLVALGGILGFLKLRKRA